MDKNSVPQDNSSTYANHKKAIYAQDDDGKIKRVESSGWAVEEMVTKQALQDLDDLSQEAYCAVKKGKKSPLFYYMYALRMDLQLLAESTGFFKWTVKKDFNPLHFSKIKPKRLQIYADALGKSPDMLKTIEEKNYDCK